jgi:vacuolar protein sorting-associated protein 35
MQVFGYLGELEEFFLEEKKRGRKMLDVYEAVQQSSEILQRLYLMVTAGVACVKTKEAPAKEIMRDLVEMIKGIQNPTRGLFLRYYMLKKLKDVFPDKASPYEL